MSSYAGLFIEDKEVFSFRNEINPDLFYLFEKNELITLKGKEAVAYSERIHVEDLDPDDVEDIEVHSYEATAKHLKDRLHVLGIGKSLLEQVFEEERLDSIKRSKRYLASDSFKSMKTSMQNSITEAEALTFEKWLGHIKVHVDNPTNPEPGYEFRNGPLHMLDYSNERVVLRAILEALPDNTKVVLDVSDLFDDGWMDDEEDEDESARRTSWELESSPPIILTEGVFDRRVLRDTLDILYPHLSNYFRFLDTDFKTEGGAGAIVKLIKSFAAAGISNRILAVFDNDTAAREALEGLKRVSLPSNFRVMLYPNLELGYEYPTLGPQGRVEMDVNGLAASIELYLGSDVLYQDDATLTPVQWTGFSSKLNTYQGEVINKKQIQDLYLTKSKIAKSSPSLVASQDWAGLKLIIDSIIDELGTF